MKTLLLSILTFTFSSSISSQTLVKKIRTDSISYLITDSVEIENGHHQKVKILVNGSFLISIWEKFIHSNASNDKEAFDLVVNTLASKAQYTLKNPLSFEPLPKQFVMWYEKNNSFTCVFELMGKNDLGNSIETKSIVSWSPPNLDK